MKRFACALLLGGLLVTFAGCSNKAEYPSDTKNAPATAPGKEMSSPKLPDPPKQ